MPYLGTCRVWRVYPSVFRGGRRAVAVLREASRPNRLYYSHWGRDAGTGITATALTATVAA